MDDIFFLVGRVALGVPFLAEGLRQLQAWPGIVGLFRYAGGPYPLVLALVTVAANLAAPALIMLGIRARPTALVLAAVTAVGALFVASDGYRRADVPKQCRAHRCVVACGCRRAGAVCHGAGAIAVVPVV